MALLYVWMDFWFILVSLAEGPSPFKPHVNGLILIAVALLLFFKAIVSLFRTAIQVRALLTCYQ